MESRLKLTCISAPGGRGKLPRMWQQHGCWLMIYSESTHPSTQEFISSSISPQGSTPATAGAERYKTHWLHDYSVHRLALLGSRRDFLVPLKNAKLAHSIVALDLLPQKNFGPLEHVIHQDKTCHWYLNSRLMNVKGAGRGREVWRSKVRPRPVPKPRIHFGQTLHCLSKVTLERTGNCVFK